MLNLKVLQFWPAWLQPSLLVRTASAFLSKLRRREPRSSACCITPKPPELWHLTPIAQSVSWNIKLKSFADLVMLQDSGAFKTFCKRTTIFFLSEQSGNQKLNSSDKWELPLWRTFCYTPVNLLQLLINQGVHLFTGSCRRQQLKIHSVTNTDRIYSSVQVCTFQLKQLWGIRDKICRVCILQQRQGSVHLPLQRQQSSSGFEKAARPHYACAQRKRGTSSMKTGSGSSLAAGTVSSGLDVFSTQATVRRKLV